MDPHFTGNQISTRRKALGLTQRELAEILHVTDKAVSKWERGINFPDLGLMEHLADALDTTPATLLGLEGAGQADTVNTLTEIAQEQLADARRDLAVFSWGSLLAAALLCLSYQLVQRRAVEAYYLHTALILITGITALVCLFRYGQIKSWGPKELASFYGGVFPILLWLGYHFITGHSLPPVITGIVTAVSALFFQLHFLQTMKPLFMKLLPLIAGTLYLLWRAVFGGVDPNAATVWFCCLAVVLLWYRKYPHKLTISAKTLGIGICLVLLLTFLIGICCYSSLVRTYVTANHQLLESYACNLLESGHPDTYGLWEVDVYPQQGLVRFFTGGSGLAPGSIYEGFYYSASGNHISFPGFDGETDTDGPDAWFRDPEENSDNWQKSTRIAPNWFWFEMHY